jgi:hypothetical protein
MEIRPSQKSSVTSLQAAHSLHPNLDENRISAVIPAESTFNISPEERINLTDKQILENHLKPFLEKKYSDFFTANSSLGLKLREKFYMENKEDFSGYSSLIADFPEDKYGARLKSLVGDLGSAYKNINEKGIFVDYLSFLTKMVKTYSKQALQDNGSLHYSNLQSPELAKLLLNIYAELSPSKDSHSDPVLAGRRQAQLESMLITNLNHILYDDEMNKSLEKLLKANHREASDLGVVFSFRKGSVDLPSDLDPSRKANSSQDLLAKPVINFYRNSAQLDSIEEQALSKFNTLHPNSLFEMRGDPQATFSSLEVKGSPLHLNKDTLVDMIDLLNQLNSSTNLKFNTGVSLKIPFTDEVLLTSDLSKTLQAQLEAKTIQSNQQISLGNNPTIFENLQKYLDEDRMLIFQDLPLLANLNNRKISERIAPIQVNTFFNQSLLIKALANLRFDNKGKLANQLNFDQLKEHIIPDQDFIEKLANVIVKPFSHPAQRFMQEIYNSIIQVAKVPELKPTIDQLTNENCLPAFNPRFISKMIKNFIQNKDERKLLVQLNHRLAGKTFLKEIFEINDDKLFELIKLAIRPDSSQSRSLIATQLNLSEPIQLKSLFKFADLLDQNILQDTSLRDLFINKLERLDFYDFAQEALKTQADIPKPLFEKILKTKVENLPDSATALLKILKDNPVVNRNNLQLFNSLRWSKSEFKDLDRELFALKPDGNRVFSGESGPLVFHDMRPFISEINIYDFLGIIEQAKNNQRFSAEQIRLNLDLKLIKYPDEARDYLFQARAENKPPIPVQSFIEDPTSLEKHMFLEDIFQIKLKPFSLPIDNDSRKSFLERLRDLDPVSKEKVFFAMKIPNKQILTELIQSKIFPVNLQDHLLERFSTKPESCLVLANQAFSGKAREDLLFRIIGANKDDVRPVVNNLNTAFSNNLNSNEGVFLRDFIVKAGNSKENTLLTGKLLEYLPDLELTPQDILDIFTNLKYISSKSLNTILENPKFPFESKLHLLEKVFNPEISPHSHLNVIFEIKKGRLLTDVSSAAIPKNQNLSSTLEALAKMPSETHAKVLDHLKLSSADHLQQLCDTELVSNQDRTRFIKSIGTFDKDFLAYLAHEKLSDDSKQHILKIAYLQNKSALAEFFSINKPDLRIKKQLISFMQRNASLIEYLPSFGFSLDEMKKIVEGLGQIDPRNYKNIFFSNGGDGILKSKPLPDEVVILLTQHALQDTNNGEQFIKFVINNEDKLNKIVLENF